LISCTPGAIQNLGSPNPAQKNTITALADKAETAEAAGETAAPAGETAEAAGETAGIENALILERGNFWTAGIPGFGENALSAFFGEYRMPGKTELLQVWLCREFLYYEGWTAAADGVLLKILPSGAAAAIPAKDRVWTVIVLLPPNSSPEEQDRVLRACVSQFADFPGPGGSRNLSLPAIIRL
jgi:hypothetical protein